ncbi:MAG: DUF6299 family protein [Actinomycetota bacterium]|nr:DUF6299 family protein [Actinomycetota bacterium]
MLRKLTIAAAAAACALVVAEPAAAQTAELDVLSPAKRKAGSVIVQVAYRCDPGLQPLEAHITVSQDEQRISGQAGLGSIVCDGATHVNTVRVTPFEGRFHRGEAFASAFLLLQDPSTGGTVSVSHAETIAVR